MSCQEKKDLAIERVQVSVPAEGTWSDYTTHSFINSHLPRIYYFVAMDCEH